MSNKDLTTAVNILNFLIEYGIPAGEALYRTIRALWGSDLTDEELALKVTAMENDARIRASLAHADASGG